MEVGTWDVCDCCLDVWERTSFRSDGRFMYPIHLTAGIQPLGVGVPFDLCNVCREKLSAAIADWQRRNLRARSGVVMQRAIMEALRVVREQEAAGDDAPGPKGGA